MCLTKNVVVVKQFLVTFQIGTLLRKSSTLFFVILVFLYTLFEFNNNSIAMMHVRQFTVTILK